MKKINWSINILNLTVFIIAAACCSFAIIAPTYLYVSSCILLLLKNGILTYSVCSFKATIKTIEFALPNESLMRIHFTNVFVYTIMYIISTTFYILYVKEKEKGGKLEILKAYFKFAITVGLQAIFQLYNAIFIFYLLLKQTKPREKQEAIDSVLNRKVPSVVFIQNQKLLTKEWTDAMEIDAEKKKEIVRNAQINEYIYAMLKDNDLLASIDEDVGFQFFNISEKANRKTLTRMTTREVADIEMEVDEPSDHPGRRTDVEEGNPD